MFDRMTLRKSACPLGIDIGEQSLRLLALQWTGQQMTLRAAASAPLTPRETDAGDAADAQDAWWRDVHEKLRQMLTDPRLRRAGQAVICLPAGMMGYRRLRLAAIPENELPAAVHWRSARELSLGVKQFQSGYYDVGITQDQARHYRDVIAVTALKANICQAVDHVAAAGLEVLAVDASAGALACALLAGREDHPVTLVVEIGVRSSSVMVVRQGRPCFIRTLPGGRTQIVQRTASRLGMAGADQGKLWRLLEKRDNAATAGQDAQRAISTLDEVASLHAAELAHEVTLCTHYMAELDSHDVPRRCCIVGGAAQHDIFMQSVRDACELPGVAVDQLLDARLSMALDQAQPGQPIDAWLVAAGLCMHGRGLGQHARCA